MEQLLTEFLSAAAYIVAASFAALCALVLAPITCRRLASTAIWRLRRSSLAVLFAIAAVASIVAQKDRTGGTNSPSAPPAVEPPRSGGAASTLPGRNGFMLFSATTRRRLW